MSIQIVSGVPYSNSSDANFRAWGGGISTALAAAGLVKVTDSGTIDWGAVLRPTVSARTQGYEVWRFDDALQSTRPVFIRLDYGSAAPHANNPGVYLQAGTAHDGAGNVSTGAFPGADWGLPQNYASGAGINQYHPMFYTSGSDSSTTNTSDNVWVASDGGSSMLIAGWFNKAGSGSPTTTGGLLLAERTRDLDGTPNGDGVLFVYAYAAVVASGIMFIGKAPAQVGLRTATSGIPVLNGSRWGASPTSGVEGTDTHVWPVYTGFSPGLCGPSKHLVALYGADHTVNSQFDVTLYGATATMRSLGTYSGLWEYSGGVAAMTGAFRVV